MGSTIILGILLWTCYFRNGSRGTNAEGEFAAGAGAKGQPGTTPMTVLPSASSRGGAGAEKTEGEDDDLGDLERPAVQPLQGAEGSSGGSSSAPLAPGAPFAAAVRPMAHRTITSTSIDSSDGQVLARRIPVVTPSFAYRDSMASSSSGSGSGRKIAGFLKRSAGGSGATGSGGATSGSGSADSKGTPYQYGVVGSVESRRGSLLAVAPPSTLDLSRGEFGESTSGAGPSSRLGEYYCAMQLFELPTHIKCPFIDLSSSSRSRRPSSPPIATGSRLRQVHQPAPEIAGSPPVSRPNTGRQSSHSGNSGDSNHRLFRRGTSSSNSHSQSRHGNASASEYPPSPVAVVERERPDRRQTTSPSHAEHIAFSNYIIPRPTIHHRPHAALRSNSGERRRSHHSATASDEGHAGTTVDPSSSSPQAPQAPHRSLSLGAVAPRPRSYPPFDTEELAGPDSVPPRRSPAPPSSYPYGNMAFTDDPVVAPLAPDTEELVASRRRKHRSRSGRRSLERSGSAPGAPPGETNEAGPSNRRPSTAEGVVTHPLDPSDGTAGSGDNTDAEAELRRLAREARRAERRIRRGSRGGAAGETTSESDRDRPGHRHRRRRSRTGQGDSGSTDNSSSGQGRKLVLRNV